MPTTNARFTEGSIAGHVLAVASTSALSLLAVFLVDILTLIYVSRLDDLRLIAAVGLAKTLMFLNGAFASGVITAAGVLVSERTGKHAGKRICRLVTHLLVMVIAVAALVTLLEILCSPTLSRWLGADSAAYETAHSFIVMALLSSVPAAAAQMCAQLLRAQGQVRLAMAVLLTGAGTLALTDPLFIFGFGLGLQGAGLSCVLSATVSMLVGLMWVRRHPGLSFAVNLRLLYVHTRRTARVAVPAMLANLAMPVGITYLMVTISGLGATALAGMAVIDRVLQMGYCVYFALPAALVPVLAQNLGAGRHDRMRQAVGFTGKLVVLYGVSLWLLLILSGPAIADYFQLVEAGRSMFLVFCRVGAGVWILFGLDFVAQSVFLTLGRAWWIPVFGWLRGTLGTMPLVYAGVQWSGGSGALLGLWTGNAVVALLAIFIALSASRRFLPPSGHPHYLLSKRVD
jgi:Na+-driven multidrug efflux pump